MSTRFTEGGAGGGATTIGGLNDVSTSNVQPNEILKYNSTSGAWENAALNITGGLTYKGDLDATNPPDLSNASQGDFYVISVAGTRFGFDWEVGDHLLVNEDMGGAVTDSKIDKVDNTEPAIFADNTNLAPTLQGNGLTLSGGSGSASLLTVDQSQLNTSNIPNGEGYITELLEDTSPQLGQNLDVNGHAIVSTSNGNIEITPNGAGDIILDGQRWPQSIGAAGRVLKTDATGQLSWESDRGVLVPVIDSSSTSLTLLPNRVYRFYGAARTIVLTTPLLSSLSGGDEIRIIGVPSNIELTFTVPAGNPATNAGIMREGHNAQNVIATTGGSFTLSLNGQSISLVYAANQSALWLDLQTESLNSLGDVDTSSASAANNALVYNSSATPPRWEAAAFPAASVAALDDIGDVTITSATNDYEVVRYDSGNSRWINAQLTAAQVDNSAGTFLENLNSESIDDLSDVNTSSASAANNALVYNSSATPPRWEAAAFPTTSVSALDDIGNVDTSAKSGTNNVLVWDGTSSWDAAQLTAAQISGLGTAATSPTTDFLSGTGADTLGGDLDVGSSSIVSSSNADIALSPNGTGQVLLDGDGTTGNGGVSIENGLVDVKNSGTGPSEIRLYCESSNAHYVGIKSAPHGAGSANYALSLPEALPGSAQYLKTDTSGNLSWDTPAGSGASRPTVTTESSGANYTISDPAAADLEDIFLIDNGANAVTITLPTVTSNSGYKVQIKRLGSANVTISRAGSATIEDGVATTTVLSVQYSSLTLVTDGTNWYII